jgi:hypothetical protein
VPVATEPLYTLTVTVPESSAASPAVPLYVGVASFVDPLAGVCSETPGAMVSTVKVRG